MALYSINRFMNIDADAVSKVYKESVSSILKEAPDVSVNDEEQAVSEAPDVSVNDDNENVVEESSYIDSLLDALNA